MIYDPNDPHQDLYDIDDGQFGLRVMISCSDFYPHSADNTVITLADWYHLTYKLSPKPL